MIPSALVAAALTEKTGRYKPVTFAGLGLMTLSTGLFALLDVNTSTAMWAGLQVIVNAGLGVLVPALLPAVQADFSDGDSASSTATWAHVRSYGAIWGITIPVAIFNNEFSRHLDQITDLNIRSLLSDSNPYPYGNRVFLFSLATTKWGQIITVFTQSLEITWIAAAAICGGTFLLFFLEKEIKLRTVLDTKFGLKEQHSRGTGTRKAPEALVLPPCNRNPGKNSKNSSKFFPNFFHFPTFSELFHCPRIFH